MTNEIPAVVRIDGEVDIANVDDVRRAIYDAASDSNLVVADLSHVAYIDSSTVGMLLTLTTEMKSKRAELRVVAPAAGRAWRVFSVSGVEDELALYETAADASSTPIT